ncbi:MAG: hypothetical protein HYZ84_06125 [Candidatus Omnitrophica bacterium]|nr:hypothetical protein [Candidatus Omnitrophota bacterium]
MASFHKNQEFACRLIKVHIEKKRLSSTYLLSGTASSQKEEIALAFAQAVNCEAGKIFESCDCVSCRKIASHAHPDIWWVGKDTEAKSVKIEEIRETKSRAALRPYEGKWKVFIFPEADRLTPEAQNALLKTLEEPPEHSLFILLVENKNHLFETVQSRSFEIRLRPGEDGGSETAVRVEDIIASLGAGKWEDFLEKYQAVPRAELQNVLDGLLDHFERSIKRSADDYQKLAALVSAVGHVVEGKEALDENANQKLALTRLAMRLRKTIPLKDSKS